MIADFLTRMALALPLVLLLAILFVLGVKRGWIPLPDVRMSSAARPLRLSSLSPRRGSDDGVRILSVHAIAPAARVAAVQFHGREHLLAVNASTLLLIDSEAAKVAPSSQSAPHPDGEERTSWCA